MHLLKLEDKQINSCLIWLDCNYQLEKVPIPVDGITDGITDGMENR